MPKEQIVNRIICSQALVNSNKIRTGDITCEDWEKIGAIVNRVATAPMYICLLYTSTCGNAKSAVVFKVL